MDIDNHTPRVPRAGGAGGGLLCKLGGISREGAARRARGAPHHGNQDKHNRPDHAPRGWRGEAPAERRTGVPFPASCMRARTAFPHMAVAVPAGGAGSGREDEEAGMTAEGETMLAMAAVCAGIIAFAALTLAFG